MAPIGLNTWQGYESELNRFLGYCGMRDSFAKRLAVLTA
jgi:hypothetical protein